MMQFL